MLVFGMVSLNDETEDLQTAPEKIFLKKVEVMTTICCVCNKTKKERSWEMMPIPGDRLVSHGYCPKCYDEITREISNFDFFKTISKKETV